MCSSLDPCVCQFQNQNPISERHLIIILMPSYVVIFLLAHKSLYSYLRTSRYIPTSSRYIPTCAQVVIFLLQVVIFLLQVHASRYIPTLSGYIPTCAQVVIFLLQVVIFLLAHKSLYSYLITHKPSYYSYFPSRILRVRVLLGLA